MAEPPLPAKKDVADSLLQGPSMFVHLDPRKSGVVVPNWLKHQPRLMLQIGLNMPIPIPDLDIGERGIACTLSFNRSPFWCFIPWAAVFALAGEDERGMIWPDDVPRELGPQRSPEHAEEPRLQAVPAPEAKRPPRHRPRARLRPAPAVEGPMVDDATPGGGQEPTARAGAEKKKLPPYLRVVK